MSSQRRPVTTVDPAVGSLARLTTLRRTAGIALVAVTVAAVVVVLIVALVGYGPDTLAFEIGKAAVGVVAVGVVGGLVGYAFFVGQQTLLEEVAQQRDRERRHDERADKKLEEQREAWRRQVEDLKDEHAREDVVLRSVLDETIATYNAVKRERRLIRAAGTDEISEHRYRRFAERIVELQLDFERLRRTAPLVPDARLRRGRETWRDDGGTSTPGSLASTFRTMEDYLHDLVREFERSTPDAGVYHVEPLRSLQSFRDDATTGSFRVLADAVASVVGVLVAALRQPLALPDPVPDRLDAAS
ncbi:hypothetical protein [Cellulomonas massiliensis]|uniref:hypothetical protein n=1 Tax=Cellulomonas massiliensis TaxID=1465811 RepID=UPI001375DFF3|nr:hypothetical protein [Cellulomonas massiliensis]